MVALGRGGVSDERGTPVKDPRTLSCEAVPFSHRPPCEDRVLDGSASASPRGQIDGHAKGAGHTRAKLSQNDFTPHRGIGQAECFGFRVSGFGFRVSGFGFQVLGFGCRVSGF